MFKVRSICAFITLCPSDVEDLSLEDVEGTKLFGRLTKVSEGLLLLKDNIQDEGYEVQTVRIATNTFTEYLDLSTPSAALSQVDAINSILTKLDIQYFNLGPCLTPSQTLEFVPLFLSSRPRISMSSVVHACDLPHASACAAAIISLSSQTPDGINNFRYCAQSSTSLPGAPFFPAAHAESRSGKTLPGNVKFSIGLENGKLANAGLAKCSTMHDIGTVFRDYYRSQVSPVVRAAAEKAKGMGGWEYIGLDSSLNPSLEEGGSVASAIEGCGWVGGGIGGTGVIGTAAAVTTAIQDLGLMRAGYCGIMLPVCEDRRLSEIQDGGRCRASYDVSHLMNVSSVCGVGVDTVPLPEDVKEEDVRGVILDVAGLAERWNKPLSVRMFPVPGKKKGERTEFDSPFLCNTKVFEL
ncbi:hypothetical protein TrRE_jg2592 [Triparma retinervis]|uniref:Uncharacterized protein n=1 Tax=Triparma retinervis TaxID=2557542 RepID=A0A9W7FE16_9STRA|nr:hypothetical protein TrRE_jg2592 [Triparma retinervis]